MHLTFKLPIQLDNFNTTIQFDEHFFLICSLNRHDFERSGESDNKPDQKEMNVTPFSSRPINHIHDVTVNNAPYALTFSDAISRYGSELVDEDLGEACFCVAVAA